MLLPPSETKRVGGEPGQTLNLGGLSFPELTEARATAIAATLSVSTEAGTARHALKLGPKSLDERLRNLDLERSPTMPAIDRYTGVLYDALGAGSATGHARAWLERRVVIQSALFGPILGGDRIPAYRLSHDSRLPDRRLAAHWGSPSTTVLEAIARDVLLLDLRSGGYRALGPVGSAVHIRIVTDGTDGRRRAISHTNKASKGRFVAMLAAADPDVVDADGLSAWLAARGVVLDRGPDGWDLVAETLASGV